MAHGYVPLQQPGKPVVVQDSHGAGGWGNPSGGAYSTLGDLLRFAQALLAHKLLSAAMSNTVLTGKVNIGRPGPARVSKYGYGFKDEQINGVRIIGHGGGAPGIEAKPALLGELLDRHGCERLADRADVEPGVERVRCAALPVGEPVCLGRS
jgi:hypothetical protein